MFTGIPIDFQGLRDPVSKSPLTRRFPKDVQTVEEGATEVLLVDVVESKVLVVAKAVDEAAVALVVEYVGKEDSSLPEDGQLEIVEYCVTVDTSPCSVNVEI